MLSIYTVSEMPCSVGIGIKHSFVQVVRQDDALEYKTSHGRSSIVVIFLSHCFTFANTSIKLPYELQASSEVRDE